VLYPIAIHYKGSGFYTTDYGKGKKKESGGGDGGSSSGGESKSESKPADTKKPAASSD
jgi:predicted nucleic acid-binding Zn ribbon protein